MRKLISWLLTLVLVLPLFTAAPMTVSAAEVTERYIYDAEVLPDGSIGVLFIYGGSSSGGVVNGGTLYYGVFDPDTNDWTQEPVTPGGGPAAAAKDAAMALDSGGNPHIAYITSDDNLGYVRHNGTEWADSELIDSIAFGGADGALTSPDIEIDPGGKAHISYLDAKGGYTHSNDYGAYEREDLIYCTNTGGTFEKTVRSYSHGWFSSPDGWRNLVYAPTKITLLGDNYCIGVKQYQYNKWMGGQDHIYGYDLIFASASLNYEIRSASTNNDLGFRLFEMDTDGSTVYSLFIKSGGLYVTGGVTEIPGATKTFAASAADMTISGGKVYYAAVSSNELLLYQDGVFEEDHTLSTAISTAHTRMATVVTGGTQYILYTGNDAEKSLFIASVPAVGGVLTEYQVPNKTPVTITGVAVDGKEYDGTPVSPGGTLTVSDGGFTEGDLVYTYTSTDGGGYNDTAPPAAAGTYKLIISVPEDNPNYSGSSGDILFTITKKSLAVTGTTAVNREYSAGDTSVLLDTSASTLSGVIEADASNVSLDKAGAAGSMANDDAGNGKLVTVTGFILSGSSAGNYSLTQPTGITVDISPLILTAPTVSLTEDNTNGGLSATVSDGLNSAGVGSYTVEIYSGSELKKTVGGISKDVAVNIPLEGAAIIAGTSYSAKAKAVAEASGNYADSASGASSSQVVAAYSPLVFTDDEAYDIPDSRVDVPITDLDISVGVSGGKAPYTFSASGLPAWAQISTDGSITGTPSAVAAGGTATITVTDAQSDSQSITIAYGAVGKGNVLVFGGTPPPVSKTYGDEEFDLALAYDGQTSNVSYSVISGPGSLSGSTLTITGAGDIVIRATGSSDQYDTKTQDYTIAVGRKPVTINPTAGNNTKIYGQTDPELAYTSTGLVGADSLNGSVLSRAAGETAGSYPIGIAGSAAGDNPDYELTLAAGDHYFTITKKPLTISGAVIDGKTYDGTTAISPSAVTAVTLAGDLDSLALNTDFEVSAASYTVDAYAGAGKAVSITIGLKNTVKANNYTFESGFETYTDATADITAAVQTITASDQSLTVGHTLDLSAITASSASGAALTFSIDSGASYASLAGSSLTGTAEGTVIISINSASVNAGGTPDPEYAAADQKLVAITVMDKIPITVTGVTVTGKEYDGLPVAAGGTPENSGGYSGSYEYLYEGTGTTVYSDNTAPVNAGTYRLTVRIPLTDPAFTGGQAMNFTITKASLTVKPQNQSIYVNDALPSPVVEYTGLKGSDTGTVVAVLSGGNLNMEIKAADGVTTLTGSDVSGSYAIKFIGSPAFHEADNYIIQTADGILTISNRAPAGGGGSSPIPDPEINTGTGTVSENQIINALQAARAGEYISVNVTGGSGNAIVPAAGIQTIAERRVGLEIATRDAEIAFSPGAVAGIAGVASQNGSVEFVAKRVETGGDHPELGSMIGNSGHVFDISVLIGGRNVHTISGEFSLTFVCGDLSGLADPRVLHLKHDGTKEYFKPAVQGNRLTISGRLTLSYFAVVDAADIPVLMHFTDVPDSAWYRSAVEFVFEKGIFSGTGDDTFGPRLPMTRGMLVTVLHRIAGSPEERTAAFTDVPQNAWYAKAAAWATENDIVNGYGTGKFGANDPVTREQMAAILFRYSEYAGITVLSPGSLEVFEDGEKVSSWAVDAMKWAVGNQFITGKGGATLDPRGMATRAEVAAVMQRYLETLE